MSHILWGTLMYPTPLSVERTVNKPDDLGMFLGYSGTFIRVVKHGKSIARIYAPEFWTINSSGWKG